MAKLAFGETIDIDRIDDIDETARRRIRAAQIGTVVDMAPMSMSINLLNAAIVGYVFMDVAPLVFLIPWLLAIVMAVAATLWSWWHSRRPRVKEVSAAGIQRMTLHAAVLGAVWAVLPVVLFPNSGLMLQTILACLVTGMISGGAFGLSTVPKAALIYTWIMLLGAEIGLLLNNEAAFLPFAVLLPLYAVYLSRNLVAHGNLFVAHLCDQFKLQAQGDLIGLLLRDFEESSSDWLWETDVDGLVTHVSDRFAAAAGKSPADLQGSKFIDLFANANAEIPLQLAAIAGSMAGRTPFRDVVVPYCMGSGMRFWLMSAKPIFDAAGKFIGYRGVGADVTEKRLAEERIAHLAYCDTITRLPNRAAFSEAVDRELLRARLDGQSAALLCLDLDQFKSINDTLGHAVGDALLASVGERIRSCTSDGDIVARLGGDEFAILQIDPRLPNDPIALAGRIIAALKEPFKLENHEVAIKTSVGIAVAPDNGWKRESLLKKAGLALFAAKGKGSGGHLFFEQEMEAAAQRRRALEDGLRAALANGEIEVAFQPLVDLHSGSIAGCEALARWNSPELGFVSPAEFIPIAEATGLIDDIGEWVLRNATREAMRWPDGTCVAVNLSPVQFKNQRLLARVVNALAESGLPPQRLELEVTESIFLDGDDGTLEMLRNLRALGLRTSLDDFGTGYSSLSYLRRFPFDKIKIDKAFIDDVGGRDESLAIIRAIVALANAIGMTTTAEGVESMSQVGLLRDVGCTQIQGYVFSPPRSAAEIVEMFAAQPRTGAGGNAKAKMSARAVFKAPATAKPKAQTKAAARG